MNVIFYIVAHADDWQLFMNPDAHNDLLSSENKVVFIVTTAGDAGKGENYWRAREEGMQASVLYCLASVSKPNIQCGRKTLGEFAVPFCSVNNCVSYFLRLPDGGLTGDGFEENDSQSLYKFETGSITNLSSLDGSIILPSWTSFLALLKNIIVAESVPFTGQIWLKFLDPDGHNNPLDHPDHQSTGRAILSLNDFCDCTKILYKGYGNTGEAMLQAPFIFWKAGMFAAYESTVFSKTGYSTLAEAPDLYQKWIISCPQFRELPH